MSPELALFWVFAVLAVGSAVGMVTNVRNTVAAAMSLVICMIALGAIYLLMEAHLVAVLQIMVYGGAIVVLFVFVVMLLNLRQDHFAPSKGYQIALKGLGGLLVAWAAFHFLRRLPGSLPEPVAQLPPGFGGYREVGISLLTDYLLPFEAISMLLLAAIVGAVVLSKRRID
jgi:NADH-quinone oxidoreductase subunit J